MNHLLERDAHRIPVKFSIPLLAHTPEKVRPVGLLIPTSPAHVSSVS
jgi:hypothetical protein